MRLAAGARTQVGALGEFAFPSGLYAYVGSAQRNRAARIRRHLSRDKTKRWHVDYFRPHTRVVAVTLCEGSKDDECRLASRLIETLGASRACPGFGASDCGCGGHLLLVPKPALHSMDRFDWPSATYFVEAG